MLKKWQFVGALVAVATGAALSAQVALAQTSGGDDEVIEEIVTLGSRNSRPRSISDSTVPVDVISGEDFNAMGGTADLTDNLKAVVPSYTATPATGDGSAFVRPTSLRGTAPDQVLILVNGKRRHRSALVQFFAPAAGNGAHGVDVGMIPGIALKRVEVLRDGASAQYGSDAIAGVINFVMKDASEGGQVQVQYGQHFEHQEDSIKLSANAGFAAGDDGFINVSVEYVDNDALSRGIQRSSDEAALLAAGVPLSEIGADAPFGDAPFLQTWGRPQTEGVRLFVNTGFDISDSAQLYAHLGLADTEGRYRFFYRNPNHSSLVGHRANGFTGLPAGFTPFLDGDQTDTSFVLGVKGEFDSGMAYDFSYGFGQSELDYFLNNTVNPDLPLTGTCPACEIPQMGFNVGGYEQEEVNLNADFSLPLSDRVNLAWGAEFRRETYTVIAGEPNASVGAGSSGFKGITKEDSGEFERENIAVYFDIEHDITDQFLVQYAARYENFDGFGATANGKLAARFRVSDQFALRGAVSTGFHAPTPGQANVRTTITTFDGATGLQVEEGLIPTTDPRVAAAGGSSQLKEETSLNISAGFVFDIGNSTTVTVDAYQIEVDDRIYRTGDIADPNSSGTISFYTNALDIEHTGIDVVVSSDFDWGAATTTATLAYSHNETDVTGQAQINGVNPVNDGLVEDIENNYPEDRWVFTANTFFGDKFNAMIRANYYGEHFDERGRINGVGGGAPSAKIDSIIYFDLELGFQLNEHVRLALGGVNIFDEFIDTIGPPNANRLSVGLQFPRRTAANYEGGSYYLKGIYSW